MASISVKELPYFPQFFEVYIRPLHNDQDLLEGLKQSILEIDQMAKSIEAIQDFSYAPSKWTPKQLIQHLIDNERIQISRATRFSRLDNTIMPGYDEELLALNDNATNKEFNDLVSEYKLLRQASFLFFKGCSNEMLFREGTAFKVKVTVAALGFVLIGHQQHHFKVLKERYLKAG